VKGADVLRIERKLRPLPADAASECNDAQVAVNMLEAQLDRGLSARRPFREEFRGAGNDLAFAARQPARLELPEESPVLDGYASPREAAPLECAARRADFDDRDRGGAMLRASELIRHPEDSLDVGKVGEHREIGLRHARVIECETKRPTE